MITVNLKRYVDASKISINRLSKITGISRPALTNMYNGKSKGIQFDTLEALCTFFNIGISELISRTIPTEKFQFIELSGEKLNTDENRIVGIQYERTFNNKTDLEVAIFIVSFNKIESEKLTEGLNTSKNNLLKKNLSFSLEWVNKQDIDLLKNKINQSKLHEIRVNNMLMNFGETVGLFKSLKKSLMAYIGNQIIKNFISNSNIDIDSKARYQIIINWNLGTESALNPEKYHFEYMAFSGMVISMDDESDGIEQQYEQEHTIEDDTFRQITHPNLTKLSDKQHKGK